MASGLIALLDDVVALAKVAAANLDDVAAQAADASGRAAGVVIDDAAVTPRYVVGFAAERELPIIARITVGSLRNKLVVLLPGALLLSELAPWAITPLLMLGGTFLAFEGAEKVHHMVAPHAEHAHADGPVLTDPKAVEEARVAGAIRTDMILSAEIMAISLASVEAPGLMARAVVLAVVALVVTFGVYGAVAVLVKADDVGVSLATNPAPRSSWLGLRAARTAPSPGDARLARLTQPAGRGLVHAMPHVFSALSVIGAFAMLWVGGGILVHGLAHFGVDGPEHALHHASEVVAHAAPAGGAALGWLVSATGSGLLGLLVGGLVAVAVTAVGRLRGA